MVGVTRGVERAHVDVVIDFFIVVDVDFLLECL